MRIDSCRKCGKTLEVNENCKICKQANEFFCHNCGYTAIKQIHSQCMVIEHIYQFESPILRTK
ncbi:MAG: hypothetical protein K8Q89_00985 [Nitrosarchaeum sp.]|nr:hypothetical protein [Nitrosarchaeum sp.]